MGGKGKIPVWVDCDPGYDDVRPLEVLDLPKAFALAYAAHSSHLTLTGTSLFRVYILTSLGSAPCTAMLLWRK